jgi:hypothetical protein
VRRQGFAWYSRLLARAACCRAKLRCGQQEHNGATRAIDAHRAPDITRTESESVCFAPGDVTQKNCDLRDGISLHQLANRVMQKRLAPHAPTSPLDHSQNPNVHLNVRECRLILGADPIDAGISLHDRHGQAAWLRDRARGPSRDCWLPVRAMEHFSQCLLWPHRLYLPTLD